MGLIGPQALALLLSPETTEAEPGQIDFRSRLWVAVTG